MLKQLYEWMYSRPGEVDIGQGCVLPDIRRLEETLPERDRRERFVADVLLMLNEDTNGNDKVHAIIARVREFSGIEAIAIRLRREGDAPYYTQQGFSEEFIIAENYLCGEDGGRLECMYGAVLEARTDPYLPFFTAGGSFWTHAAAALVDELGNEIAFKTRNRCVKEGYESIALIPLRSGGDIVGLLQLNDRRPGLFTEEGVVFYETLGSMIGVALRRMLTEERLRESEAHHKAMLAAMPSMIFRAEADGTVLEAEGRRCLFYIPPEEHIGRKVPDYLPQKPAQMIMAAIKRCVGEAGEDPVVCEYSLPIRGCERWFEARIVRYAEVPGQILAVVSDITDARRRLEERG